MRGPAGSEPAPTTAGRASRTVVRVALRVLIVDDHEGFRAAAGRLARAAGLDVVGEACDGEAALALAATLRPDVVLLDVQLPGIDGFDVAARLSGTRVVLVSSASPAALRRRLARTTAAFIPKTDLTVPALRAALAA